MEVKILTSCDTEWWAKVAMYAKNCSWQPTGQYLSNRMKNNEFSNWERVFVALENGDIAGFCALSETSTVFGDMYTPYISFLFVGESYRGNKISKTLIASAIEYAKTIGLHKTYLYSDLTNFYEKYGFDKIDEKEVPWGIVQTVYMHSAK